MRDFIDDRKAACDAMKKWAPDLHAACADGDADALQASELFLAGWDAANAREPQWIPCSERLPKNTGQYLTYYANSEYADISHPCRVSWFYEKIRKFDLDNPTHWMPLPRKN